MILLLYKLLKGYSKYCECGCKTLITCIKRNKEFHRFKCGHHVRGKKHHFKGYTTGSKGYIYDYRPNHPFHDSNKTVGEHRLVYEHYLSIIMDEQIYLDPKIYAIHHINKNVKDNSLINLELLTHSEHAKIHFPKKDTTNIFCFECGRKTRIRNIKNRPYEDWYGNDVDGWKCNKCYGKEYRRKKRMVIKK